MTKLNRKISTARKLRKPRKIPRSRLSLRPRESKPQTPESKAPSPLKTSTPSYLKKTAASASFVAKNSTTDAKIEFQQVLPGPTWLPENLRKRWLRVLIIRRSFPPHLLFSVVALSTVLMSVILIGLWHALTKPKDTPSKTLPSITTRATTKPQSKRAEAINTVSNFLSAETIKEKLSFIRHADVVGPQIRQLHQDPSAWAQIIPTQIGENPDYREFEKHGSKICIIKTAPLQDQPLAVFFLTHSPDGRILIDWDATNHKNKTSFTSFRERRSTETERFRVSITPYNYYNYGFIEEEYLSLKVTHLAEPDVTLFAYAKKNSPVAASLRKLYPGIGSFFGTLSVTAELRYLPESNSSTHLEFVSLVHPGWVLPDHFYER